MRAYLQKMRGGAELPPMPNTQHMLWTWMGASVAIGANSLLTLGTDSLWLMAPFGATAVLAFGVPDSPLAQPRNIIGGHFLAALVGLIFLSLFGTHWWSLALAVPTAIVVMQASRTVHPPAGANPLVVMLAPQDWNFLFSPVLLGAVVMVLCAVICNNLASERRYPLYWI